MDSLEAHNPKVAIICDGEQVGIGTLRVTVQPGHGIVDETLVDSRVKAGLPDLTEHTYELQFINMLEAVAWQACKTPQWIGRDM